jgi:hypothetical protein
MGHSRGACSDRLLEEQWLGIDGISGTSAGAMKGALEKILESIYAS